MPGISTLQCYCSGYASSPPIIIWSICAIKSCKGSAVPPPVCKQRKCWKSPAANIEGLDVFNARIAWHWPCNAAGIYPRNAAGGDRATLNLSKTLCFVGYDVTCAAPSLLIVQRRALCVCNADPCAFPHARAIPIPLPWFHALCPPHPFYSLTVPTQPCAKRCKIWIRELTRVNVFWRIAVINADIHRAGGNRIFRAGGNQIFQKGLRKRSLELLGSWQVEKSYPQISPVFSHQRFQISNQISPKKFTTHFCRHGNPKKTPSIQLSGSILRDMALVWLQHPVSHHPVSDSPASPQQGAIPHPLGAVLVLYRHLFMRYPILQHIARYLHDTRGQALGGFEDLLETCSFRCGAVQIN